MTDILGIDAKRWEKKPDPNAHKPVEALKACLRDIESGTLDPKHIIVVYASGESQDEKVGYYQAGELNGYLGALGLLTRATQIMSDS